MSNRKATFVIAASALVVVISMGLRQSFGLFLQPISQDLDVGREVFSLAMALQNIVSGLPLVGIIADCLRQNSFAGGSRQSVFRWSQT